VHGIKFTPFILDHGPNNTALGFRFGSVVYLSDLSGIPEETRHQIASEPIELLIIDALRVKEKNSSHYNLPQALAEVRHFKPKKTYLIGMCHEFEHTRNNNNLRELLAEGLDVELSYDGLKIPINIKSEDVDNKL